MGEVLTPAQQEEVETIWREVANLPTQAEVDNVLADSDFVIFKQRFRAAIDHHQRYFRKSSTRDDHEAAFYQALGLLIDDQHPIGTLLAEIYGRIPKSPSETAYYFSKVSHTLVNSDKRLLDPHFPAGYDKPEPWLPVLDRIASSDALRGKFLSYFILPIASNVSERGKLLKASLLLNGRHGDEGLEIGCSLKHIFKRLAVYSRPDMLGDNTMHRLVQYEPVEVLDHQPSRKNKAKKDTHKSEVLNRLMREESFYLGPSACLDFFDADRDKLFEQWATGNSFYMGELLDERRRMLFNFLSGLNPQQLGLEFIYDNAATWDPAILGRKLGFVYIATMLYGLQDTPDQIQAILERAEGCLKPDGLLVIQDFVDIKDGKLKFDPKRGSWSYKVWVKDMAKPELGFQHYFTAEGGRAKRLILGQDLGRLAVARQLDLAPEA